MEQVLAATGVVLAGGQSRRMGEQKAALLIGGEPLLRRVVGRLQRVLPDVIVIGPPALSGLIPGRKVLPDRHIGIGPLAGLETALQAVPTELAFIVACDMPFIAPALVEAMVRYALAHPVADVVALARGTSAGVEHLHAAYRTACLAAVSQHIAEGRYALHDLFARLHVSVFPRDVAAQLDPRGLSTFNANTPEEWRRAQALVAEDERQ